MAKELISLFGEGLIVGFGIWGLLLTGLYLFWLVLFYLGFTRASREIEKGWY